MASFDRIGSTLGGRYQIQELIGQGGMSSVYKALDPNLQRIVAVKMIHPHMSGDPKFSARFEDEARAVARLRHPNIVQVFDFNNDGDVYYMVQEYLPGESLQALLHRYQLSGEQIVPRNGDPFHDGGMLGDRLCPPTWDDPSRYKAGQYHDRRARSGYPDGFWDRQAAAGGFAHDYRDHCRYDRLYASRPDPRRSARASLRYLLARRHAVRDADRSAAFPLRFGDYADDDGSE